MAEKSISQIPRHLREQYEKGKTAFDRQNFDYAVAIFNQVLEQDPAFYDCREALRASQFRKSGGSTTFLKKMLSGTGSAPLLAKGQVVLNSNPKEAMKMAEQILNSDPNSAAGHKLLAEAAMSLDLPKTAVLSLEIAVKNAPKDEEIKKDLARAYSASGQGERGEAIFEELIKLHPSDLKLQQEMKDISATNTLSKGYEQLADGSGSYRDILANKDEAVKLEQANRQVKTEDVALRMIAEFEEKLKKDPNDIKSLRSVAELYDQQKNFDKALETYQRAFDQGGGTDASLLKVLGEAKIRRVNHIISQLNPETDAEKIQQMETERDAFLLTEVEQRAEKYPNDLAIRFDLAKLYFQTGKTSEAIREFQKAKNNPSKRIQALAYLGQCFAAKGMNDMAARQLQDAIKEKITFDDEKKEMVYTLGIVLDKMGKKEESMDQFKQIYEVDYGYKDVAQRVEGSYGNA